MNLWLKYNVVLDFRCWAWSNWHSEYFPQSFEWIGRPFTSWDCPFKQFTERCWYVDITLELFTCEIKQFTERCWYVDICDRGAFWKYRTSAASEVFLKSAEITNIYIHSRVRYDLYHLSLDRTHMDSIDRSNFDLLKVFFDSSSDEEKKWQNQEFHWSIQGKSWRQSVV